MRSFASKTNLTPEWSPSSIARTGAAGTSAGWRAGLREHDPDRTPPVAATGPSFSFARISVTTTVHGKPTVGLSSQGDRPESEADDVADRVHRAVERGPSAAAPATIQRQFAKCEDEDLETIQRKRASSATAEQALDAEGAVRAAGRGGRPMPKEVRSDFERRFGHDFRAVRIHDDSEATAAARAVQARAYTFGRDIVFGSGEYAPATTEGRRLLAHELVHVVQQTAPAPTSHVRPAGEIGGESRFPSHPSLHPGGIQRKGKYGETSDPAEHQADAAADSAVAAGSPAAAAFGLDDAGKFTDDQLNKGVDNYSQAWLHRPADWTPVTRSTAAPVKTSGKSGDSMGGDVVGYPRWFSQLQEALVLGGPLPTKGAPAAPAQGGGYKQAPPDPNWSSAYGGRVIFSESYAQYEKEQGPRKPASEKAGAAQQKRLNDITIDQLFVIYPNLKSEADKSSEARAKVEGYLKNLNDAFKIMQFDTVQSQALYLAHAWAESNQFRTMTESQDPNKQPLLDDPHDVNLNKNFLNKQYPADVKGDTRRATIDPEKDGSWAFLGHGPLQVTHQREHLQTLAVLEKLAEQYELAGDDESKRRATTIRQAVAAIKKDPSEAANPAYAFLFSAGFMAMRGAETKTWVNQHYSFAGTGGESSWMTGGIPEKNPAAATGKAKAYERAVAELSKDAEPMPPKGAAPAGGKPSPSAAAPPVGPTRTAPTWDADSAAVHHLLEVYLQARFRRDSGGKNLPSSVDIMAQYIGASEGNRQSEALVQGSTGALAPIGCGESSYRPVIMGLQEHGYQFAGSSPQNTKRLNDWLEEKKSGHEISEPEAYTAPLQAGDIVTFVGPVGPPTGHVATIIREDGQPTEKTGSTITFISGNAGLSAGGAVRVETASRTKPPEGFSWSEVVAADKTVKKESPSLYRAEHSVHLRCDALKRREWDPTAAPDSTLDMSDEEREAAEAQCTAATEQRAASKAIIDPAASKVNAMPRPDKAVWVTVISRTSKLDANAIAQALADKGDAELAALGLTRIKPVEPPTTHSTAGP